MAKSYKFTPADVPQLRRGQRVLEEIVADFMAQGTESMLVTVEG
jgi:hypothetical protein